MAAMTRYRQLIATLHNRVKLRAGEIQCLADALTREDQYLARKGQADLLAALRARVTREVEATRLAEDRASSDFTWAKNSKASANLIAGGIKSLLFQDGRHLQGHARRARFELSQSAPFRTVVVQIAPPGKPPGVAVVSLSRLARESGRSEFEISNALVSEGYHLIEPASFVAVADELMQRILGGVVSLPVTDEQVRAFLASHAPEAKRVCPSVPRILAPGPRPRLLSAGRTTPGTANESTPTG